MSLNSLILWRNEPFEDIRRVTESSLRVASAIDATGVALAHRVLLCTLDSNGVGSEVQSWADTFGSACSRVNTRNSLGGADRLPVQFEFVVGDQQLALSDQLDSIMSFAVGYLAPTGMLMIHDVEFDDALARWAVKNLIPLDWKECCLASVRARQSKQVGIAYVTSVQAYLLNGLATFGSEHRVRSGGFFRKSSYGINRVDDLAWAMGKVAASHGWRTKELQASV
jgi:hypothetical protein